MVLDALRAAAMIADEARNGRFPLFTDFIYLDFRDCGGNVASAQAGGPDGTEPAVAGMRTARLGRSPDLFDGVIGGRGRFRLGSGFQTGWAGGALGYRHLYYDHAGDNLLAGIHLQRALRCIQLHPRSRGHALSVGVRNANSPGSSLLILNTSHVSLTSRGAFTSSRKVGRIRRPSARTCSPGVTTSSTRRPRRARITASVSLLPAACTARRYAPRHCS